MLLLDPETRFFANLLLDAEISNTPLEGQFFADSIGRLSAFLKKINKGDIKDNLILKLLPPEKQNELRKLGEDIAFLEKVGREIHSSKYSPEATRNAIFKKLTDSGHVFLPGGWISSSGSHAMVYQLVIDTANNRILFLVSNSGTGLGHHPSSVNKKVTKYSMKTK